MKFKFIKVMALLTLIILVSCEAVKQTAGPDQNREEKQHQQKIETSGMSKITEVQDFTSDCSKVVIPTNVERDTELDKEKGLLTVHWYDPSKGDVGVVFRYADQNCSDSAKQMIQHLVQSKDSQEQSHADNSYKIPSRFLHAKDFILGLSENGVKVKDIKNSTLAALFKVDPNDAMQIDTDFGILQLVYFSKKNAHDVKIEQYHDPKEPNLIKCKIVMEGKEDGIAATQPAYFASKDYYLAVTRQEKLYDIFAMLDSFK